MSILRLSMLFSVLVFCLQAQPGDNRTSPVVYPATYVDQLPGVCGHSQLVYFRPAHVFLVCGTANDFHQASLLESTVAHLPAATVWPTLLVKITDGASSTDCTTGLGTTVAVCAAVGGVYVSVGGGNGGGAQLRQIYFKNAAVDINGGGAATLPCAAHCGTGDAMLFLSGSAAGAVNNLTGVGALANNYDKIILPAGYNNQTITIQVGYFNGSNSNVSGVGSVTFAYYCGTEGVNPSFTNAVTISLPALASGTVYGFGIGTFTPTGCASTLSTPVRMQFTRLWSMGSGGTLLTYLGQESEAWLASF